ncbi:hypothetical protein [Paenibacillus sp. YIM B09110]|uniref:hypothetical protein n=1 Tax=Paenibacillus sp. YIM B09110 TaxID=3126102 RepID=UPI00301CABF6
MKREVDQIVRLVYEIANQWIDESKYKSTYNTLRRLTKKVWSQYHKDLLDELRRLDNPRADYQLFWLECLGYPRKSPNLIGLDRMPLSLPYHALPSDFNSSLGLHDSRISEVIFSENDMIFNLKLDSWEYESGELTFHNVSDYCVLIDDKIVVEDMSEIIDFTVMSDGEAPNIEYCISHLKIPDKYSKNNNRLFYIFGANRSDRNDSIYIFAESWSWKTF